MPAPTTRPIAIFFSGLDDKRNMDESLEEMQHGEDTQSEADIRTKRRAAEL
ncbi:MAG: hypothetical protein O2807_11345 [bacterium]|nr:hypothetical protein [bacterium]